MRTNGFSKERYDGLLTTFLLAIPLVVITLFFAVLIAGSHCNDDIKKFCDIINVVTGCALAASLLIGVLIGFFATRAYKRYAAQVIDYDDETDVKGIHLNDSGITVEYGEDSEVKTATIVYSDYGIEVHRRENFEHPVFYTKNGIVRKVIIPYTTKRDAEWTFYKIR